MEILRKTDNKNIIINQSTDFKNDMGWSESFQDYENEVLDKIINDIDNYETIRYIHEPYSGITINTTDTQSDIWFYFYFTDGTTYKQDYELVGITNVNNSTSTKDTGSSFFRLEFYKTPNDEYPTRVNRKFVFAKNLSLPLGEKFNLYTPNFSGTIKLPVFTGSNYRNKENMYLFWFQDDTPILNTPYTGNTFFMTARFFNTSNGQIYDFSNKDLTQNPNLVINERRGLRNSPVKFYQRGIAGSTPVEETRDSYYRVTINRNNGFTYKIFYGYDLPTPSQSATPTMTPTISMTPPPPTPPPTLSPTPTSSSISYNITIQALEESPGEGTGTLPVYCYYSLNLGPWIQLSSQVINSATPTSFGTIGVLNGVSVRVSLEVGPSTDITFGQGFGSFIGYCGRFTPYTFTSSFNQTLTLNVKVNAPFYIYNTCP